MRILKTIFQSVIIGLLGGGGLGLVIGFALYYWATIETKSMEPGQAASYLCAAGEAPFALSPRSGRQSKAWGGAEGGTPGQLWNAIKPVKRAAAPRLSPTSRAAELFTNALLGLTPHMRQDNFLC